MINQSVLDNNNEARPISHFMYIDNDIYLDLANKSHIKQAMAAGINVDLSQYHDPIL